MKTLKHIKNFRCDMNINKKLAWILRTFPDRFKDESNVIRAAIIILERELKEEIKKNAYK